MLPGTTAGMAPPPNQEGPSEMPKPVDVDEDEVEEIPGNVAAAAGGKIKLPNFAPEEDVNIVKSWLEISCDPIISTGQRKEHFWQRVLSRYNGRRGTYPERSLRSIQTRWDKIKLEAGKFAGHMANTLRDNASGTSAADKTTMAAATHAAVEGHHFPYMHCWEIMKDEPKWRDIRPKGARPSALEACGAQIPPPPNTIAAEEEEAHPAGTPGKRPMGRDAAKRSRKKTCSSGSNSSSEYASKLQDLSLQRIQMWREENTKKVDRFDQLATIEEKRYDEMREHNKSMLYLEQEKLRIMRDKLDMQMREKEEEREAREKSEDERILKIDLDSCTPELRMYYEAIREEILLKMAARRQRNQNTKKVDRFDELATIEEKRYDEMREHNKSMLYLEQEKLRIMRDKLDMQMREKEKEREAREKSEDERILKIDLDSCTPELRMYYEAVREEILRKVAARRQRNQRQ